jgi:hypothetical protein
MEEFLFFYYLRVVGTLFTLFITILSADMLFKSNNKYRELISEINFFIGKTLLVLFFLPIILIVFNFFLFSKY